VLLSYPINFRRRRGFYTQVMATEGNANALGFTVTGTG